MDYFNKKTKSRKVKRLAKRYRFQMIVDLFYQAIEIIVVLLTVAKLCYQLVITFEDSGVVTAILTNRTLAFAVGNAILIALLLNQEVDLKCKSNDLYEEFVRESSTRDGISQTEMRNRGKQIEAENKAKQSITETRTKQSEDDEEKQSITENIAKQSISEKTEKQSVTGMMTKQRISVKGDKQIIVSHQETTVKKMGKHNLTEQKQSQRYQRSRSENLEGLEKGSCRRLSRSETDAPTERFDSNDELRYKIESFIARQRRNQSDY